MKGHSSTFSVKNKKCVVCGVLTCMVVTVLILIVIFINKLSVQHQQIISVSKPKYVKQYEIQFKTVNPKTTEKLQIIKEQLNVVQAVTLMKNRWKKNLIGDFEISSLLSSNPHTAAAQYITVLSQAGQTLFDSLIKREDADYLWPPKSESRSAHLKSQFSNLLTLAKAYGTNGTSLYKDENVLTDIKNCLFFLTKSGRYDGKQYYGNWWDWQIGIPQNFLPIIFIVEDKISTDTIKEYAQIISSYIPNSLVQMYTKSNYISCKIKHPGRTDGTNRVDIALNVIGAGMLLENSEMIRSAVDSIHSEFGVVTHGNGFYEDGSFIYHKSNPYAGAYGNNLIYSASQIFALTMNTDWQTEQEVLDNFVSQTRKSFVPFIILNGDMMPMVKGRAASRLPLPPEKGPATLFNLLAVAEFSKNTDKNKLLQAAKYFIKKDIDFHIKNARDFQDFYLITKVMNDAGIDTNTKPFIGSIVFGSMDRAVFSNSYYTAGISMYSSRISSFAAGNNENKRGWHSSDGMLYVYNEDQQFSYDYWPTVDPYRLPGTTVDTVKLEDEIRAWQERRSFEPFVGGVTNGNISLVMMQLNKNGTKNNDNLLLMNLKAKKSWFMFGEAIIALGSDIDGDTNATIETVIENRKLDEGVPYNLIESKCWLLLQGPGKNKSLGYLMLQNQTVKVQKEEGAGSYREINDCFPSDIEYRREYQKILIIHGSHVRNGSYAYAIVPHANKAIMENMTNRFNIIQNTKNVQAVYDNQKKLLAAVVWSNNGEAIKGYKLNTTASFIIQDHQLTSIITLSNPKQSPEILQLTLPFNIKRTISTSSPQIHVLEKNIVIVNTTNSLGNSFSIEVERL